MVHLATTEDAEEQLQYACINCGHPVKCLYKQYSSSVLKIIECDNCSEVADKYIEYEPIVVLLDIVLLNREAYRHVLFNTHFRIRWKLAVVLVLLSSYILAKDKQKHDPDNAFDLSSEQLFYICFLLSIFDLLILSLLLLGLTQTIGGLRFACRWSQRALLAAIVKCVTLAGVTRFFLLPAVIWHNNTTVEGLRLHELLVGAYYLVALVQVVAVLVNCGRRKAGVMVGISMAAKMLLMYRVNAAVESWL